MKQKRPLMLAVAVFLCLMTLTSIASPVLAAPEPGSCIGRFLAEPVVLGDECPVAVVSERLCLDFRPLSEKDSGQSFRVTVLYELKNLAVQNVSVNMALPFVSFYPDRQKLGAKITADGQVLAYEICRDSADADPTALGSLKTLPLGVGFGRDSYALLYSVDFLAGETRNVTVSYNAEALMSESFFKRAYSYTYLLSPASKWADFGKLEIQLIPAKVAPKLKYSNIDLAAENGYYTASLDGLPESELIFSFTGNKSLLDILYGDMFGDRALLYITLPFAVALVASVVIAVVVVTKRRKEQV